VVSPSSTLPPFFPFLGLLVSFLGFLDDNKLSNQGSSHHPQRH
jgi:hypothetical protein